MKAYLKPEIITVSLEAKENIASVIPTVPDADNSETSIPNNWDQYWD